MRVSHKDYDRENNTRVLREGTVTQVIPPKEGIPFPMYVVKWDEPNPKWDCHSYSASVLNFLDDCCFTEGHHVQCPNF